MFLKLPHEKYSVVLEFGRFETPNLCYDILNDFSRFNLALAIQDDLEGLNLVDPLEWGETEFSEYPIIHR